MATPQPSSSLPATESSLPNELWNQIASYLTNRQKGLLFALNRYFFELNMNAWYGEIELPGSGKNLARTLYRLKDPSVAARVRILKLYTPKLHFYYEDKPPRSSSSSISSGLKSSFKHFLRASSSSNGGSDVFEIVGEPGQWHKNMFGGNSFLQLMQVMSSILPTLPNVVDIHITWGWLPMSFDAPPFLLKTCFARSHQLRALTLNAQIRKLKALLPLTDSFPVLEELHLSIAAEQAGIGEMPFAASLTAEVGPFINRLTSTLQVLSLKCYARADYSTFFLSLATFPILRQFGLVLAFDNLLSNGSTISTFISNHTATLEHLYIEPLALWPDQTNPIGQWVLRHDLHEVKVENVRELRLNLSSCANNYRYQTLVKDLAQDVTPFASTLVSLTVEKYYFKESDCMTFLKAFSGKRLRELSILVEAISPQLVDFLAKTLVSLKTLRLKCGEITAKMGSRSYGSHNPKFFSEMALRVYEHWLLRSVHLSTRYTGEGDTDTALMEAFRISVPSLW